MAAFVAHGRALVYLALVLGGAAWMAVMSTFNTATQTSAPPWVRSRAVAMHALCALGLVRDRLGVLGRAVGPGRPARRRCRWRPRCMAGRHAAGAAVPAAHGRSAGGDAGARCGRTSSSPHEPDAGGRPGGGRDRLSHPRRRRAGVPRRGEPSCARRAGATARPSGASTATWPIRRATSSASSSPSWADYLHQRARATLADRELEAALEVYLEDDKPVIQHYVAER